MTAADAPAPPVAPAPAAGPADLRPDGSPRRLILACLALAVSYFALAMLGLAFRSRTTGDIAVVWPANGVALAALLLAPRRWWAPLVVSAFAANVPANLLADRAWGTALLYAAVNAAEVLVAGGLMRSVFPRPVTFATTQEVVVFAVFACAGGGALGGLAGASAVGLVVPGSPFGHTWRLWAVVDALGLLAVTPVIVTLARHRPLFLNGWRLAEKIVCLVAFTGWCWAVFDQPGQHQAVVFRMPYVTMLPFLLWAGLRFDPRATSLLTLIMVSVGAWYTVNGRGPLVQQPRYTTLESVIGFQASAMLWGLSAMVLAAVTAERRATAAALALSEARARAAEAQSRDAARAARAAELAATESHARVQAIFDNASASIFLKGLDGRYLSVNRTFERAFGKAAAEVVGRTNHELFPSAGVDEADARDAEVVRNGRPVEYEWHPTPGAADQRVFWIVKFPVRLADGSVQAICGISTDITARKRAEHDLEAAKEAAEDNARRAEALAWRADAANRAKTEFLANISHEIRTPLTAIFGYADLLLAPAIGAEERIDHVQTIRRNGEHLLSILNDVLDMSKIEAGRMTVERVPTPVPQVVADVVSLMRQRATEKGLELGVACPTPVPVAFPSDPTRVRQILMNLVGNAVKFTEAGGVHVDVWVDESHRDAELVFEVTDTGIGMTPEQVAAAGRPFTQGDPSHARRFGGSGLGLSICYRLAQLMGGTLTCQSRLHAGSAFTLRLPCGDLAGVPRVTDLRDVTDAPAVSPTVDAPVPVAGRVLVAEDAPDTRRLLMTYLRNAGIEGETAENGQVAVARAMGAWRAGRPYDLLLMDVQMPQMDGLTATGVLRSHGYTGRIVALTANAMDQDRQRCLAAGCDEFLTKPIRGTALLSAVRHWLGDVAPDPAPRAAAPNPAALPVVAAAATESFVVASGPVPGRLVSELADDPDVGPLLGEYLHELREKADAIAAAVRTGDWPGLARLAHQVKGSAGGYGYPALSESASALERAARSANPAAAAHRAARVLLDLCADAVPARA